MDLNTIRMECLKMAERLIGLSAGDGALVALADRLVGFVLEGVRHEALIDGDPTTSVAFLKQ